MMVRNSAYLKLRRCRENYMKAIKDAKNQESDPETSEFLTFIEIQEKEHEDDMDRMIKAKSFAGKVATITQKSKI